MVAYEAKGMHALIPVGFSPLFSFTTPNLKKIKFRLSEFLNLAGNGTLKPEH